MQEAIAHASEPAVWGCRCRVFIRRRFVNSRRNAATKATIKFQLVGFSLLHDPASRPLRSPLDVAVSDPVVGLAAFAPIADQRPQTDRNSVANQRPACGMQRGVDGDAAATWAQVFHHPVATADVGFAMLQFLRNRVHELWRDLVQLHECGPRQKEFITLLQSMTYSQLSSRSRSL